MIILQKQHYEKIVSYALNGLPNETCGLLGGYIEEDSKVDSVKNVEAVYLLTNTDHSPEHFSMDPLEQLAAVKDIRKNHWQLLGNFHSHPETPARPSAEDIKMAYDAEISYLILSLADRDNPVFKSFKIKKDTVLNEEIVIQEEE